MLTFLLEYNNADDFKLWPESQECCSAGEVTIEPWMITNFIIYTEAIEKGL